LEVLGDCLSSVFVCENEIEQTLNIVANTALANFATLNLTALSPTGQSRVNIDPSARRYIRPQSRPSDLTISDLTSSLVISDKL